MNTSACRIAKLKINRALEESCGALMMIHGALGVQSLSTDDEDIMLQAFYPMEWSHEDILSQIQTALAPLAQTFAYSLQTPHIDVVEPNNWATAWKSYYKPICMGKLWIVPAWESAPQAATLPIYIHPGTAFGTGQHETTQLCMQLLEAFYIQQQPQSLLDYGCGSGILAIAAAKLGCPYVLAVDCDADAIHATQDNAQRNRVEIHTQLANLPPEHPPVDMICANIIQSVLKPLAQHWTPLLKPNGLLLLSGLLLEDEAEIRNAHHHLTCIAQARQGEWAALLFKKMSLHT
jgi:ribosomal protein L11 methyltransferase